MKFLAVFLVVFVASVSAQNAGTIKVDGGTTNINSVVVTPTQNSSTGVLSSITLSAALSVVVAAVAVVVSAAVAALYALTAAVTAATILYEILSLVIAALNTAITVTNQLLAQSTFAVGGTTQNVTNAINCLNQFFGSLNGSLTIASNILTIIAGAMVLAVLNTAFASLQAAFQAVVTAVTVVALITAIVALVNAFTVFLQASFAVVQTVNGTGTANTKVVEAIIALTVCVHAVSHFGAQFLIQIANSNPGIIIILAQPTLKAGLCYMSGNLDGLSNMISGITNSISCNNIGGVMPIILGNYTVTCGQALASEAVVEQTASNCSG